MPGLLSRLIGPRPPADPKADPALLARQGAEVRARLEAQGARNRGGRKAELFVIRDFLAAQECEQLIRLIENRIGPSTLFNDGGREGIRTSSTHYFDNAEPLVRKLAGRIDGFLGLDRIRAETMQGQRYLPGEQYRHHCDFFRTEREHWQRERRRGGQRSWTAMLYLNAVEAGGATEFPRLDLTIEPEPGTLVVWNNMTRAGHPNRATQHAGLPVEAGRKYVITQWYRQEEWTRHLR